LRYAHTFVPDFGAEEGRIDLLTAAAIGGITKTNATISEAEVGHQDEVRSASAMALEHHLGMTCDPVAGLVQVPYNKRNAFGAVKAVTAASLSLHGIGSQIVSLDAAIETMRQTGWDMSKEYKETSFAGVASQVSVSRPKC
jgi:L-serine dehydratase